MDPEQFYMSLFIDCLPCAQPRAKATAFGGHARMYSQTTIGKGLNKRPHPSVEFRYAVREAVRAALPDGFKLLENPVSVSVVFIFPRTSAATFKKRPNPPLWHTSKQDRDNLDKPLLDCLTKLVWADDGQVCDGRVSKVIAKPGGRVGVRVVIQELVDGPDFMDL